MKQDEALNIILKRMWEIDETLNRYGAITTQDNEFYNKHLHVIQTYYERNAKYWKRKLI